ncbi:MAG: hypothetical protein JW889_12725 [Verrucomicrobia bacterium]|nr:hypothetical protein [Verrucomicrobiota bacterium]
MQHPDALMAILMFAFAAVIFLFIWRARRGHLSRVRKIGGIAALEEAVGRATETGRPVVFAMGGSDIMDIMTHASLAVMSHIARLAARVHTRFVALVRIPNVFPVAEEFVREAYKAEGVLEEFDAEEQVRFVTDNAMVYAMSVARYIEEHKAGCAVFLGAFDFTSLLMTEPGAQMGVIQIAGDPYLWQVPFFVCTCDYTIMGEEYFAAGAYVSPDPTMRGTLVSQDIIKAIFVGLILLGLLCYHLDVSPARWFVELLQHYK